MRGLHAECSVPRAEIHLLPSLSHLQCYLHPTTHRDIYVLVGGPQPPRCLAAAGGMHGRMGAQRKQGTWQSSTLPHAALPFGIGMWEGREALPSGSNFFSRDDPIFPTIYGE